MIVPINMPQPLFQNPELLEEDFFFDGFDGSLDSSDWLLSAFFCKATQSVFL